MAENLIVIGVELVTEWTAGEKVCASMPGGEGVRGGVW